MSFDWIGSIFQSQAQDNATKQNAANIQKTNAQNLLLSIMARGAALTQAEATALGVPQLAGQSSAILPYYLSDIEKATGTNAGQLALALQANAPTVGDYSNIIAPYLAQMGQSRQISQNLLSGDMTNQMLAEEAPVASARMNVAQTQKDAALQALDETLSQIDAIQARKGYSGDSFGNRMAKFNARASILGQSAGNIAQANLANAQEKQAIQQQGRQMQLSNLNLPGSLASTELQLKRAPTTTASSTFGDTMQPLSFFNIGNHPFQQQNLPLVDGTSQTGLAISGIGANANGALNYGLNRYFQRMNDTSSSGGGGSVPSGFNGAAFSTDYGAGGAGGAGAADAAAAGAAADYGGELSAPAFSGG